MRTWAQSVGMMASGYVWFERKVVQNVLGSR